MAPAAAAKSIVIDAEGDSTMRGTVQHADGTYEYTANSSPANLQLLLQKANGTSVTVVNSGVGGSTVANVLNGVARYTKPWKDALPTNSASIVIANWAINDSNPIVNESTTVFENDLIYWIQITQAAGKAIVLEEPQPVCNASFAALPQYVAIVNKVATQLNLPLVKQYDYIQSLADWQSYLGSDCTHPADDRLYQIKAQREYDVIEPLVAKMMGVQPAPRPAPLIFSIDAEGDSTFYGTQIINGVTSRTQNNTPALLQKLFGSRVAVLNNAKGGATLTQSINGTAPRYSVPFASRLPTISPSIVLSNFGINDAEGGDEDSYRNGLRSWISTVRTTGAIPVLEEPNPVCDATHPKLDTFVGILRSVATEQNVVLIAQYDYIKSLPNWHSMLTDCVHPSDVLYQIKAQREYTALTPLIATLQK
ncbi:SGNH/GDSL hydrolase family protein [Paraburkholderia xenovorans]